MQLLQRASFPSPAVNPLLILCGCCALVRLIYSVCLTSGESLVYGNVAGLWMATWSLVGGTGSNPLLLTFLCIKFPETNSMSVPRRNFKRLHSLFKQAHKKPQFVSTQEKVKQSRKKGITKNGKSRKKLKSLLVNNNKDKLHKSKQNFVRDNFTAGNRVPISLADHAAVGINHKVNLRLPIQDFPNSAHAESHYTPHVSTDTRRGKRKSGRRGKNANEFTASTPALSAGTSGFSLIKTIFMNQNEEEVLRRKVLDKVEELDPLMCLPKVLCGYSSRRRRKNYFPSKYTTTTTTTSTTQKPKTGDEDIINEYLHLLGINPPIQKEQHEDNLKEAITYLNLKTKSSKEKKRAKGNKKKPLKNLKDTIQKDIEELDQQSGSASSSAESDESIQYRRYPVRKRPDGHYARFPFYPGIPPFNKYATIRMPQHREKFLFNRNRDKESEENDLDEDDSEVEPEDDEVDELLDDEDVKYIVEKAKMKKMMSSSGSHSDENWWEPFDEQKITMPMHYYYPPIAPPEPTFDSPPTDDILSMGSADEGWSGWISNMFGNFMPSISWAGNNVKKDPDDIKNDPFFTSFDGRSLTNRKSKSFSRTNRVAKKLRLSSTGTKYKPKLARTRKQIDLERFGSDDQVDPAAKYRIAVEIGSRVVSSDQCDFIYNGCPLSYEEILAIINEPVRQKPVRTRTKPFTTTTTSTTSTTLPTTTKGTKGFAHNFITPPPPQQIVVPLQLHHEQQFPYQSPQTLLIQQQRQRPHYHNLHPQHSYEQAPAPGHLYSHPYLQQLAHLPQVEYNPLFRGHPSPTLVPNTEEVAKSGENSHKTKFHQALADVEINVRYRPSAESSEKRRKPYLPHGSLPFSNNNFKFDHELLHDQGAHLHPYTGSASVSSSYEHSLLSDPFNHKVLTYPSYEFFSPNGYKIRRKEEKTEKSSVNKDDAVPVVSNTIKLGGSSPGSTLSASAENSNNVEEDMSHSALGKNKQRTQRVPTTLVAPSSKGKGKFKRKQMFKNASSSSSAPPLRHSSSHHDQGTQSHEKQQQAEAASLEMRDRRKKKRNGNNKTKKYGKGKRKGIQNDDNSSGNSGSNNSSAWSTISSNEKVEYNKGHRRKKQQLRNQMYRRQRKKLKKKRRKPHLHKQSSESSEAKKRLKIAGPNAIYPIYGHPFPPPYAGYYHTHIPSTPTSPSFFSYFFGR